MAFPSKDFSLYTPFLDFSTAGIFKNAKFKMQLNNSREMRTIKYIKREGSRAQVARKSKVRTPHGFVAHLHVHLPLEMEMMPVHNIS